MRILLLFFLGPVLLFGQVVEPRIHPAQIGNYSAVNGCFLRLSGGVGVWETSSSLAGSLFLPSGTSEQTMYHNGTSWVPTNQLKLDGTTTKVTGGFNVESATKNLRIVPYADRIDVQSYPSVPLEFNAAGNEVRFPAAATSVPAFLEIAPNGRIGAALEIRNNPSFFEVQSYSKPLYLNRQGNNVLTSIDSRLGVGTTTPTALLDVNGTGRINTLGLGGLPDEMLHLRGGRQIITTPANAGTGLFINTPDAVMNVNDEYSIDFQQQGGTLGRISGYWSGSQYGFNLYGYAGGLNRIATFTGNGNVGIGTNTPSRRLHVEGNARITASEGVGTLVMLRNAAGDISNATLSGLTLSGGTLSVNAATNTFFQGGNSFGAAAVLGTNDANTMRVKANSYGITINNTGYIQLDDTPTGPPSTPPAGSIFYSSNSQSLFFQEDVGAANTVKILTDKPVNALLLLTSNNTPGGANYNIRCDANAGAFTITLGASLQEGKPYLVRCTRNSTNAITFTAASGYTLGIDTDTALNPTTLVSGAGGSGIAAPARIYIIQRIGTVINIK